jgi:hypothetical protein
MSDLYEAGFIIDLEDNLSEEIHQTLLYMIGQGAIGLEPSGFEHPLFHDECYKTDWRDIISSPREEDEEMIGGVCGSTLVDNRLVFRGLMHDDPFWNVWTVLIEWLLSISNSSGVIGYYRNLDEDDNVTLISFESDGVCFVEGDNYDEFEELQEQIIEKIDNLEAVSERFRNV